MKSQLLILPFLCFVGHSASAWAQSAPPAIAPPSAPPPAPPAEAPPTIQLVKPQEPAAAPPPKIDLSTEPPAKPVQRTYHFHEGFYLRASVGFGYYYGSFNDNHRANADYSQHGGSMSLDLLIGGSPSPGLSIGGGLLVDPLFGASYERHGREIGSHGGVSMLIGPFIDAFPDATKGWHLGGLIGFGGQSFQNVNVTTDARQRAAGFGGAAWFGYDFWVSPEWSGGPQFRAMGMSASNTKDGEDISSFASSFDLGVSIVFN
ncbi:MAG TPA: hypothetical protein VER12_11765 [Polyangiaceae bacterium]|nr:hypothetical protein [Polyangiaceae bacterium]